MKLRAFSHDLHVFNSSRNLALRNLSYFWFFFLNTDLRSQACSEWKWGTIKITNGQLIKARNLSASCLSVQEGMLPAGAGDPAGLQDFFFLVSPKSHWKQALLHSLSTAEDKVCSELKYLIMCKNLWKAWRSKFQRMSPTASPQIQPTLLETATINVSILPTWYKPRCTQILIKHRVA